jgi:hypothetical protein
MVLEVELAALDACGQRGERVSREHQRPIVGVLAVPHRDHAGQVAGDLDAVAANSNGEGSNMSPEEIPQRDAGRAFDTGIPTVARVYDALLGGWFLYTQTSGTG